MRHHQTHLYSKCPYSLCGVGLAHGLGRAPQCQGFPVKHQQNAGISESRGITQKFRLVAYHDLLGCLNVLKDTSIQLDVPST